MATSASIASAAQRRIREAAPEIRRSLAAIQSGRPGDAETDRQRRVDVIRDRQAEAPDAVRGVASAGAAGAAEGVPEAIQGQTVDFVDVAFLERGMRAARSVCRLLTRGQQAIGTGFLISPRLVLTNNHVIGTEAAAQGMMAEFFYERDAAGSPRAVTRYSLAPQTCFLTLPQDDLDFTVVALGPRLAGDADVAAFGFLPLNPARNKHQLGDFANIIQHPDGRMKEAVVRENRIVSRPASGTVLHYATDTLPGASGSPVFNTLWDVIALHHWGGPHRELFDEKGVRVPQTVNEGIRASAIVLSLETKKGRLASAARAMIDEALRLGIEDLPPGRRGEEVLVRPPVAIPDRNPFVAAPGPDGTVTWVVPLAVTVRLGGMPLAPATESRPAAIPAAPADTPAPSRGGTGAEFRLVLDENYDNRDGYDPAFLRSVIIPLPKLSPANLRLVAKNREPQAGDPEYELRYEHFSVVMNARRRLAFFTATNIDGKHAKNVDRRTGKITSPRADDDEESLGGAEAAELWFSDSRIREEEQSPPDLFSGQTTFTPDGEPITDRRSADHRNRMFQQGHLTRRQDPLWGCGTCDEIILRAHADTFHVTNRAPQVGYFNMGTRKAGAEARHAGGNLHWRALEEYVLANAIADKLRVSVFTGPVFDDQNDFPWSRGRPDMKGFKAPRKFWKLVLRVERGKLMATALIADQSPLIDVLPEAMFDMNAEELSGFAYEKVARYHVAVEELQNQTGLEFGSDVVAADTFREARNGVRERRVATLEEVLNGRQIGGRSRNSRHARPQ